MMHLDVRKVILAMVMFSNLGGASTGIGDPPNVLIINSPLLNGVSCFVNGFIVIEARTFSAQSQ